MKFSFNLKNKELSLDANVEGIVEKQLENRSKQPNRKTRYQIKQEEKRKNEELKNRQQMKMIYLLMAMVVFLVVVGIIASVLGV